MIMKKILILLLFLVAACGYQPLYKINNDLSNLKISDVQFKGDAEIGNKVFSKIPFQLIKNDEKLNKLIFESFKEIIETSKNSKGQVTSYRTKISLEFILKNKDDKIIDRKKIVKNYSYNVDENKFKFKEFQDKVEENLIDRIIEDIVTHLNY